MIVISPFIIMIITFFLSATSIAYELILANALSEFSGDTIFWQGMTIGIYILGIGVGTFKARNTSSPLKKLLLIEFLLTILGAISIYYLTTLNISFKIFQFVTELQYNFSSLILTQNSYFINTLYFTLAEVLTFFVGFLTGFELPLLFKLLPENSQKNFSSLLGINYFGTLLGSLMTSLVLVPHLDLLLTSLIVAFTNFIISIYLLSKLTSKKIPLIAATVVSVLLLNLYLFHFDFNKNYLKVLYHHEYLLKEQRITPSEILSKVKNLKDIERISSPYQDIDFFESFPRGAKHPDLVMMMDSHFQFSTYNEGSYHQAFAHIPIYLTNSIPENVLVLGAGDGLLIRELLKHQEIKKITHIELDEKVIELFKTNPKLTDLNKNSLNDPRVLTITNDAFYYIRNDHKIYDAIYIDFPYPNSIDLSRLYSIEFYKLIQKRLNQKTGFVVLDAPIFKDEGYEKEKESFETGKPVEFTGRILKKNHKDSNNIILSTLKYSGFQSYLPYQINLESFVLLTPFIKTFDFKELEKDHTKFFTDITEQELKSIPFQLFPHKIREQFVNSIFRPRWKILTI